MNAITSALRAAFDARQSVGEETTFRDETLTVPQINRAPGPRERARYNFEEDTESIIELPPDLDEPTAGEVITDSFDRSHRIRRVAFDSVCWVVGCIVSASP